MKTTAKDIRELSRRLKPEACTITRIAGAYVDAEKKHHHKIQRDIFEHGRYRNVQVSKHYQENLLNKDR